MAVDEAILEAVETGDVLPTLRLYAWEPACLSLGYSQPIDDVDLHALTRLGWDIVRRPTGGQAILHVDELTYSVAGPLDEPRLRGGVLESYQRISVALTRAIEFLGINVHVESQVETAEDHSPICFEVPSKFEITHKSKKLIGSAQTRKKNMLLQHGTLPLFGDLTRILEVLKFGNNEDKEDAGERLVRRATTLQKVGLHEITWEHAAQAFEMGFEQALNLELEQSELSARELERAEELIEEKYGQPAWTEHISLKTK